METNSLEAIYEKFLNLIERSMQKHTAEYNCIMGIEGRDDNFLKDIESFLKTNNIPFIIRSSSVNTGTLLRSPVLMVEDYEESEFRPSGIFCIYPDSEIEIITCFYHWVESVGFGSGTIKTGYIVAYRDQAIFDAFVTDLKKYRISKILDKNEVIIVDDDNVERPNLSWDDIILPPDQKDEIRKNIEYFMQSEALYRNLGLPYKRGLLFVGPPGNGKTMLLKVIASQYIGWQILMFTAKNNSDNWDLNKTFQSAKEYAPSIICFEDLDTIFNSNITMSHFLNKLDGFGKQDRVMVIATTNHPEAIDPALLSRPSRFDRVWVIDNPDIVCRKMFIRKKFPNVLSDRAVEKLAEGTDKFSMAYMEELYIASSLAAINHGKDFPEEGDIFESAVQLSLQVRDASHNFEKKVKQIGFAV